MILFNAFPLEDPDLNRVDLDAEIQKQLDLIEVHFLECLDLDFLFLATTLLQ